jgi:hypothetical protein
MVPIADEVFLAILPTPRSAVQYSAGTYSVYRLLAALNMD